MSSYSFSHGHIEDGQHRNKHKCRNNNNRYLPYEHAGGELTGQQKWLSIGALGGHATDKQQSSRKNFARLRKGYASMRKSFRVLGATGQEEEDAEYSSVAGATSRGYEAATSTSLINQIGSNAARLLRRGVTQVRLNKLYAANNDAIQCTDGSFKIISPGPRLHYGDAEPAYANLDAPEQLSATTSRLKSEAEREVDMRLRRSKRRVLPSAQYKPPNSERACEGLDLEELEEIKRDNLRLTLRSQKTGSSRTAIKPQAEISSPIEQREKSLGADSTHKNNVEPHPELDAIVCSCKHFEGKSEDEQDGGESAAGGRYEEIRDSKHYYCSCASISSFSCQSEETANNSQVQETTTTTTTPVEQDLDLAATNEFYGDDDADETHEKFVNLLAEGRKALSQPNLSCFAYASESREEHVVGLHHTTGAGDDDKDEIKGGGTDEGETIECESGMMAREQEQEHGKVEVVMELQNEEEIETASYAHANSVTLNVRELEKLCGDLVKSCAQHQLEREQLCDVVGQRKGDGDDYHNEKCAPADDGDSQREQQREVTTCSKKELLGLTNSNERRRRRRTTRVAREQVGDQAKHKYRVEDGLNDCASALRSSCQQQVGGVSRPSKATRADHHYRPSDAEQQQQQVDRAPLAASRTAPNNQSDRDLHDKQLATADSFDCRSPDTTCGGSAADLTSGHLSSLEPSGAIIERQQAQLISELDESEENLRNTNKCQASNESTQTKSDPIYQTVQESGQCNRDSERRRRQQLRRQEIMLSLTGHPEHLWHELVTEGRLNERAVDTKVGVQYDHQATYEMLPQQATAKENIYSSLYEDLAQGQYCAINVGDYETTGKNYKNLQEKERRLFEEQINHLRIIKESSYCDARESQWANHHHHHQHHTQQKPHKKSLLSKLKNLLAPAATAAASANAARGERDTFAHHKAGWMTSSQNVSAGQQKSPRWDDLNKSTSHLNSGKSSGGGGGGKSSTQFGSMSTQNLFNSSMRYLSTSRKSVNLAGVGAATSRQEGEMHGSPFSSKSFISGFLTLGRRSGAAAAATTTKGRKASSQKKQQDFESLSQLFKNNRHQQEHQGMHRGYGSFDSLPSADSGLSCGHLQNTSSCDENNYATTAAGASANIYSCTPAATLERVEQQFLYDDDDDEGECDCDKGRAADFANRLPPAAAMVAVGRARAKVDCNPCAYDKEALVFKKGDIIDILERHQSGTWIGRCEGRVGHFKFINVAEIKDHDSRADQQAARDDDAPSSSSQVSSPSCDGLSPLVLGRPYVTKLEIKNGDSSSSSSNVADGDQATTAMRRSLSSSSSLAHKDQEQRQLDTSASKLASSSETLMGSLEQLLASIGLDNCRQVVCPEDDRSCSCDNLTAAANQPPAVATTIDQSDEPDGDLTYLEILKRGGINSLDSFSAIEQSSDLERIGIIDDEHQRRLLMAAKIIRQALRAAKLDLQLKQPADNRLPVCKSKPITTESGGGDSSSAQQLPPPLPPPLAQRPTDCSGDKTARLRCKHNQATASIKTMGTINHSGDCREPVYVNLLNTNKVTCTGSTVQSAAAGCNESARASSGLVTTTSKKSISKQNTTTTQTATRQNLTSFGTNFLFNDLSQVETVELAGSHGNALQLDYDHYQDHNECRPMTITNQRYPALLVRNNISAQHERTSNTSQRSVQEPHLVSQDCTTAAAATAALPKRGVNNSPDSINQAKETDCYPEIMKEMQELVVAAADGNNNRQTDHKSDEPISSPRPPPFTRGCSVRVSSRKPKRTSSRLTSREPRRGSQDCSRIYLPPNSVSGHFIKQRDPLAAHCSIRSLRHRESSSDLNQAYMGANIHHGQLVSNCTFVQQLLNSQKHSHPIQRNRVHKRVPPPATPTAPTRGTITHQTHDSYHHLLNSQSQIMNSKSAYDLRVNFSKFLEN